MHTHTMPNDAYLAIKHRSEASSIALRAALNTNNWGPHAAARHAAKRGVSIKLVLLAMKLEGVL